MRQRKISISDGIPMILAAGVIDLLQFFLTLIPVIGWLFNFLIGIMAAFIFGFWFSSKGISILEFKRVFGFAFTSIAEMIPFLDAFPWWTGRVTYMIITERE